VTSLEHPDAAAQCLERDRQSAPADSNLGIADPIDPGDLDMRSVEIGNLERRADGLTSPRMSANSPSGRASCSISESIS
jgi:hypothetical protein